MSRKIYFYLVLLVLFESSKAQPQSLNLSAVLVSYEQALQDFIKAHQAMNPTKPIELTGSNVVFSTYCKIIHPYIAYVAGYGQIVNQEFARKFPYHADLLTLSDEFFKYDKEVKHIALFFPVSVQPQVIDYFYEQLTDNVVQVCYQIIKDVSYALSLNSQDLASVYVAYNLAWAAQTKNMKMTGLTKGEDFQTNITKLMVTLYQAAVMQRTHSLAFDAENVSKNKTMSEEIGAYQQILYHVYKNNGQKDQAAKQLLAIKSSKKQLAVSAKYAKDFGHATKLPSVAEVVAQTGAVAGVAPADVSSLQGAATSAFTQAQAAEVAGNFAVAMTQYGIMQATYLKMLSAPSLAADANSNKSQYFLAKTRWTASSLASTIAPVSSSTLGGLTNVPTLYVISAYEPQINLSLFATTMPSSLSALPLNQWSSSLSDAQKTDVLQVFKAYLVSQVLSDQSTTFSDCFNDYTLSKKTGLSSVNKSIADDALEKVTDYMKDFSLNIISSVDITSATTMTIMLVKMPLPAVTPLYSVGICAADYFLGAHSLFQPGSALISLYGSTYVPGNDTVATQMMLQDMAYAYCCAAQDKLTQATSIMQKIIKMIDGSAKGATKTLPKEFTTMYAQVKKAIIQAQALLVAQNTSAQAYFVQAGLASLAQAAQAMYIKVYQTSITFMKQCLVGDPVAAEYNNLLLDINTAYLQWASELNVESDAVQIAQINQEIVSLFVVAGEQCLKTSHEQAMYPGFKQVHYDSAAQNFLAAQKEYKSMSDTKMVKAMEDKIKLAYLSGCDQNMELYFYVKNHGVSYKSSSTGQMTVVSFDQMCQDYTSFEQTGTSIDPEEMHAYNSVQNLLLVATMLYQYLTGLFSVPAVAVVPTVSVSTTKKQTSNQKIVHYLRAHKALTQTDVVIPFGRAGVKEKILQVASPGYVHFLSDKSAVVAWLNMLIQVVQNVYMEDYLGATTSEASTQITKQTKEFFDAVQKEASSMQNPSSAYVG